MDGQGFVKVVDFGFAKPIPFEKNGTTHTKSFTLCGTPEYLSPELVLSRYLVDRYCTYICVCICVCRFSIQSCGWWSSAPARPSL
jgi:serine/threonine protein kinase